jgi:hypothetical protein
MRSLRAQDRHRNVGFDNRQIENLDMKGFTGRTERLKVETAVTPQTKI